jgi:hypothetical protein
MEKLSVINLQMGITFYSELTGTEHGAVSQETKEAGSG